MFFVVSLAAVCSLPVAKRNFLRRHGHGLVFTAQQLKENVDAVYCKEISPTHQATTSDEELLLPAKSSASIVSEEGENEANDSPQYGYGPTTQPTTTTKVVNPPYGHFIEFDGSKKVQQHILRSVVETHPAAIETDASSSEGASDSFFTELSNDEKQWLSLFRERPCVKEQSSATSWMDKVLTVVLGGDKDNRMAASTPTTPLPVGNPLVPSQTMNTTNPQGIGFRQQFPLDVPIDPLLMASEEFDIVPQQCPLPVGAAADSNSGVPLVEPGMTISEENFATAVQGIDFSTMFVEGWY